MNEAHIGNQTVAIDPLNDGLGPSGSICSFGGSFPDLKAGVFFAIERSETGHDEGVLAGFVVQKHAVNIRAVAGNRFGVNVEIVAHAHLAVLLEDGVESFE